MPAWMSQSKRAGWFSLHFNKEAVARNPSSRWNCPAFEIVESSVTAIGKRAIVVVNKDSKKTIMSKVDLPNSGNLVVATPERPDTQSTSGTLQIPARSAPIIMEL
jgi:hypothetical protein